MSIYKRTASLVSKSALICSLAVFSWAFCSCSILTTYQKKVSPVAREKGPESHQVFPGGDDSLKYAYMYSMLASLAIYSGQYEEAREYLVKAVENDRQSLYLHEKIAQLLKDLKRYKESLTYALHCLDLEPDNVEYKILVADIYALLGEDDLAAKYYEEVIVVDPENRRTRLILITILIRKNRFADALLHLDTLIEQEPGLTIAYYYRGRIYLEKGERDLAEKDLLEALRLNEDMEPALFDLGVLYQISAREKEAIGVYEKLLKFFPDNTAARERLADLYLKSGNKERADEQIALIKGQSKPGEPGRQSLGLLYFKHGRLDESIDELEMIVRAWPEDHKSRYYLAVAYEEKGIFEKAKEHFSLIGEKSKYFLNSRIHIAYILETQKKYDEAVTVIEKCILLKKDNLELYLMLASVYEAKEDNGKAIKAIEQGLKVDDKNIDLLFRLGVLMDKSGDKAACMEQMRKILTLDSDHAEALNYIGYTYAEQGVNLDEAMELIQKAIRIKPDSGYIIDSLGWVYFQKGDYDKALYYLEKATELTPDDPTISEHMGDVYFKKKNYKKALEMYTRALLLKHPDEEKLKKKISRTQEFL